MTAFNDLIKKQTSLVSDSIDILNTICEACQRPEDRCAACSVTQLTDLHSDLEDITQDIEALAPKAD